MGLFTAGQLAERWKVPLQRVYELTRSNKIPVIRLGERQYRYSPDEVERFERGGGSGDAQKKNGDGKPVHGDRAA